MLQKYYCDVGLYLHCKNIYKILKDDFLPITKERLKYDESFEKATKSLEKYIDDYFKQQDYDVQLENEFSKLNLI